MVGGTTGCKNALERGFAATETPALVSRDGLVSANHLFNGSVFQNRDREACQEYRARALWNPRWTMTFHLRWCDLI